MADTTRMRRDYLGAAALLAALVGTASAEYGLALAVGFGPWLAACVPAALDIYALRAFASKRDVPAVVVALIAVNAVAHLIASGLLPVSVPVVVAVSAIAPLVLWRVHALTTHSGPEDASAADVPTTTPAPVPASVQRPAVPVPVPADPQPARPAPAHPANAPDDADELLPAAQALADRIGRTPPLRMLQAELAVGQRRAQRIQAALAA
ncbi:hypothetical protein [Streptomyces sp. NPDC001507]|uniref:hypothetical protein n=1 Tax=Streptomyces sp. NPDC001507 TaxID=3364579 RepID=UPI00368DBFA9